MIGTTVKNYLVEELLGRGGMGVVYRARDTRLDRRVALKVLPPDLVKDEDRRRRFVQEAKAASAVNHPAIAQIYEIEEEGDLTFIVMEHVDGATVRELVGRRELDLPSGVEVGIQVAEALARAHEAGIVHRDIKSDNIMVTRDGHPKILDFGLAKLLDPSGESASGSGSSRLETVARTQAGVIMGTVAYMSPEQARGLPADRRSDIFSLGVVLYEMATGRLPFEGASALDTMHAIAFKDAPPAATQRAGVPWSLQRVIDRCLQKRPEDRYPDMREVARDLRRTKREIESGVSGGVPIMDRFRWWGRALTGGGMLWLGLGGAVFALIVLWLAVSGEGVGAVFSLLPAIALGAAMFRRFRNRGVREVRRFVKKASRLREVHLIAFHDGAFTVVADAPTARTYVRLNALLASANGRLFRGEPMTMVIREDVDDAALRSLLSSPGVQHVREEPRRRRGA